MIRRMLLAIAAWVARAIGLRGENAENRDEGIH
jgi:hypothetical protein